VSIGPVAATVGILFWGWLWGVMGLLLAVPLTAFIKLVADLHPSLCHLSNMLALTPRPTPRWVRYGETALERAIPYLLPRPEKVPVTLSDENRGVNDSRPQGIERSASTCSTTVAKSVQI
jgi:hypothetical protein